MLILISILGLILRLILVNQSFWLDEGASIVIARSQNLIESLKLDFHPPLFYFLLKLWLPIAGHSEWAVRLPFILLATLTIPVLYFLCKEVFGKASRIPLISALFLALNPLHIYYSQELRMYSLVTLMIVFSWLLLIKKKYSWLSVINALSVFTFYGAVFNLLSQVVFILFSKSKSKLKEIFLILIPSVLLFILWFPVFSIQLQNGNYLKNILPGWQVLSGSLTLKSLLLIPLKFILGRISFEPQKLYFIAGGIIMIVFLIISSASIRQKKSYPIWIALITPLIVATLVSLKTPVLGYWRFLFILPFFLTLLAAGVENQPKIIFYGTIFWICGVFIFSNIYFWTNPQFQREDWRGLSQFVNNKNAIVFTAFPYTFAPLEFYTSDARFVPTENPDYRINEKFVFEFQIKSVKTDHLYYMDYLADLTDPDRQALKLLEKSGYRVSKVYNFRNLGQLYEFQHL